jgi:plasmid maintenance system killer protein
MSRGRKGKSQKGTFLEDNMRRAVRQVLVGEGGAKLSLRKAEKQNDVSFQTLQRYVKKEKNKANPSEQISMKSNYKHRLIFTENEENQLVQYVIKCSKMCYGQTANSKKHPCVGL